MTLGCRAFFSEFLDEFEEEKKRTNWDKVWDKNKIWTAKMPGTGASRKKKDYGLIGRVGQKFGYMIQAEWMRIDQVWYLWLPEREGWEQRPWKTEVVVEHENDINNFEYTIFKLGEVSAPLKVGIFYPGEYEKEYLEKAREIIKKQVTSYPGEMYLIIFGFQGKNKGVYWHGYEIDFKGNIFDYSDYLNLLAEFLSKSE